MLAHSNADEKWGKVLFFIFLISNISTQLISDYFYYHELEVFIKRYALNSLTLAVLRDILW